MPPKEYPFLQFAHLAKIITGDFANWIPRQKQEKSPLQYRAPPRWYRRKSLQKWIRGRYEGRFSGTTTKCFLDPTYDFSPGNLLFMCLQCLRVLGYLPQMESTISGMFFSPPPAPTLYNYPPSQLSGVNPSKTSTGEYSHIIYRIQCLVIDWPS